MSQKVIRRTQIDITEDEQAALDFLKALLGLTSDTAARRLAILEAARSRGWLPREEQSKKK